MTSAPSGATPWRSSQTDALGRHALTSGVKLSGFQSEVSLSRIFVAPFLALATATDFFDLTPPVLSLSGVCERARQAAGEVDFPQLSPTALLLLLLFAAVALSPTALLFFADSFRAGTSSPTPPLTVDHFFHTTLFLPAFFQI